jgi:hypothetical protein
MTSRVRAFATALLAASLSFAGPGAVALASAPAAPAPDTRAGENADGGQPFVARSETAAARLAVRGSRSLVDGVPRDLVALLTRSILLAPSMTARALAARDAQRTAPLVPATVRSSRGPPAA